MERLIDLAEQDKQCACCHSLVRIGEDCAKRVDVIPPQIQVIRIVRPKYGGHHCEGSGDEDRPAVRVAPAPPALIPKTPFEAVSPCRRGRATDIRPSMPGALAAAVRQRAIDWPLRPPSRLGRLRAQP